VFGEIFEVGACFSHDNESDLAMTDRFYGYRRKGRLKNRCGCETYDEIDASRYCNGSSGI